MGNFSIAGLVGNNTPEPPKTGAAREMGKNEFLNLLVTQMQYQDPLEPMKNEEFVAQLAQFSSLEQLSNLNTTMNQNNLLEQSINNSQAVNLIGKDIVVMGNSISMDQGKASSINYELAEEAESVTVSIYDDAGVLVKTVELNKQSGGKHDFEFDGKDKDGNELADGNYTFTIDAKNADGDPVDTLTFANVHVDAITFDRGFVYLLSGNSKFLMSDVVEVREN